MRYLDGSEDGLKEDEYEASVATLQSLAATLEADCVLLRQSKVDHGLTGQYLVRRRLDRQDFLEIRFLFKLCNFFRDFYLLISSLLLSLNLFEILTIFILKNSL